MNLRVGALTVSLLLASVGCAVKPGSRTWVEVGESDVGLRDFCERMAARDPATFDKIHADWVAWEAFVAPAELVNRVRTWSAP